MEKKPPPRPETPAPAAASGRSTDAVSGTDDTQHAEPSAIRLDLYGSVDDTTDMAGRPSRREGARVQAYASVSGEAKPEDVAASTPFAEALGTVTEENRYEAGALLGEGGMGEVVLNLDHRIGRHVARKTLLKEVASDRTFARFVREARVQGQLEHPSVVPVYDFGIADGAPFFTMKRVRGETLGHILERLAVPDPEYTARFSRHKLLAAFRQVCLAVEYAHLRGVVHRDLKPSNIMLGDYGEVYVLDWGLAKLRSDGDVTSSLDNTVPAASVSSVVDSLRTTADDMIGTPAYMSPEQFGTGRNTFDTRQDVFALGAVLFEILTLTRYRPGASFATLLPGLVQETDRAEPTRPSSKVAGIAPELDEACVRALETKPSARLSSAGALAEVIDRYLEGDRDQGVRNALATALLNEARAKVDAGRKDAAARVEAMRDAIKVLALTPDNVEAQRLLLSLVVDGSGELPPEAEREFSVKEFLLDAHALKMSIAGLTSWFITLPLAMWIGIRDWTLVAALSALTLTTIGYLALLLHWRTRASKHVMVLAVLLSTTLALTSRWLGPFVLVPVAICCMAMLFGSRCTPSERRWIMLIFGVAVLAPFGVDLLHIFPPTYTFENNQIILHPGVLDLTPGPTLLGLAYTSVTFMFLPMVFIGQLRDKQRDGDRRLFVQAWHLRQLFPAAHEPPR